MSGAIFKRDWKENIPVCRSWDSITSFFTESYALGRLCTELTHSSPHCQRLFPATHQNDFLERLGLDVYTLGASTHTPVKVLAADKCVNTAIGYQRGTVPKVRLLPSTIFLTYFEEMSVELKRVMRHA